MCKSAGCYWTTPSNHIHKHWHKSFKIRSTTHKPAQSSTRIL